MKLQEIISKFLDHSRTNSTKYKFLGFPEKYSGLKLDVSFGQGAPANIPWISFLGENQSTSNGIYPVYLFFKKEEKLILAYGVSEKNNSKIKWRINPNTQTIQEYFNENNISPQRYGDSYVYKVYDTSNIDWGNLETDLNFLLNEYKSQLNNNPMNFIIEELLKTKSIQDLLSMKEFWIEKARLKLKELDNFIEPSSNFFQDLLNSFVVTENGFSDYLNSLDQKSNEYKIIKIIGELISYCDRNAADKNVLNEYEDKRTLAQAAVRQNIWVQNFLKYKLNNSDESTLTPSVKNAVSYLKNPENGLTMLSEKHRKLVSEKVLNQMYSPELFVKELLKYFKPYNISPLNNQNYTRVISLILYTAQVIKLWEDSTKEKKAVLFKNQFKSIEFNWNKLVDDIEDSGLIISKNIFIRFICSLLTKPFVILTGLSGSGKTKLAQVFAKWICEGEDQYCLIPVGADWTNREPLLGFPNALEKEKYVKPDNGVLDLIIKAEGNPDKPYFLILDEMNLSHVERYFADFLSIMESKDKICIHSGEDDWDNIPAEISFLKNLFIIGTVNIDETTYMFSPKVLDRASVIEFRITNEEIKEFMNNNTQTDPDIIKELGAEMAESFVEIAKNNNLKPANPSEISIVLLKFFDELKKTGAEFGYRTASEIMRFAAVVNKIEPNWKDDEIIDAAIMQKLLPKVHGSRRKLEGVLKTLGNLCLNEGNDIEKIIKEPAEINFSTDVRIKYPVSLEKIIRMYKNLISNSFTSYAEA